MIFVQRNAFSTNGKWVVRFSKESLKLTKHAKLITLNNHPALCGPLPENVFMQMSREQDLMKWSAAFIVDGVNRGVVI